MTNQTKILAAAIFFAAIALIASPSASSARGDDSPPAAAERGKKRTESLKSSRKRQKERIAYFRNRYVRKAPKGFKPRKKSQEIRLRLIPEKRTIRRNGKFRYRLELQNVGKDKIYIYERLSFIRTGAFNSFGNHEFHVISPNGKKGRMWPDFRRRGNDIGGSIYNPPGWENLSEEEKDAAIKNLQARAEAELEFEVVLYPGETLFTRPWKKEGEFRDLKTGFQFKTPGTYKIWAVYTHPPDPIIKEEDPPKKILHAASKKVTIEVMP